MMHQVKDIIIYPIKGMAGIHLIDSRALSAGFEYDRRWMLIDDNNQFITQRAQPNMALFQQSIVNDQLTVSFKSSVFSFSLDAIIDEVIETKVWDDLAITKAVGYEADEWFSYHLNQNVRLVKILNDHSRIHHSSATDKNYSVSLADGYPYLIIGEASLSLLNEKMSESVPMNRFRPNIVVSTVRSHEEDDWQHFAIGSATFVNIKPCGRCNVITIDQKNAKINNEILKILSSYRKNDNNVFFGTNVVCTQTGILKVGDTVQFLT